MLRVKDALARSGDPEAAVERSLRLWLDGRRPAGTMGGVVPERVAAMHRCSGART